MNMEDRLAIINAAQSFRKGAPIMIPDIRLACWADGHPIDHVSSKEIPAVLHSCCEAVPGPYGNHDSMSWVRRL